MIKNIIFDFDGVLAESVNVKTEAFRTLYQPFGDDIADQVVKWHEANGGVSRFEKIKTWHLKYLGIELSDSEVNYWANKFSDLVLQGVVNAPWVLGAFEFLEGYSVPYSKWIISGTPDSEMKVIAERRNISQHFKGIHGSPRKKTDWATEILSTYNLHPQETVFIGDARSDFEASINCNLHFILRKTPENIDLFPDFNGIKVSDLKNLHTILKTI